MVKVKTVFSGVLEEVGAVCDLDWKGQRLKEAGSLSVTVPLLPSGTSLDIMSDGLFIWFKFCLFSFQHFGMQISKSVPI